MGLLANALANLHERNLARRNSLKAGSTRGEMAGGGGHAVAAGNKQLGSCAAGKRKYTALCIQLKVSPRGDFAVALLGRCVAERSKN
jgi:hypothetical protein